MKGFDCRIVFQVDVILFIYFNFGFLGCNFLYCTQNEVHPTHCVEVYLQCGLKEIRSNMLLELSTQILHEPCYNVLRTQEQLGYIVHSDIRRAHGVQGLRFIVQSEKPPAYVDGRIEAFLHSMQVGCRSFTRSWRWRDFFQDLIEFFRIFSGFDCIFQDFSGFD